MATLKVSSGLCKEIDRLIKSFWWSNEAEGTRYLALKAWDEVCMPKDQRGMGFQKFDDINLAILSKLAWKMARDEDMLWVRLLGARYLKG